jgi:hypothetical protein
MDWLHEGARDAEVMGELSEGFSALLDVEARWEALPGESAPPASYETAHLLFKRVPVVGDGPAFLVRFRSVTLWKDLLYLRRGEEPNLGGCLWFFRNAWPVGDDIAQDASMSVDEWIVREVMES